jgi:hypothetical protein
MDDKVFKIEFKCQNCSNEWAEEYCKGDEVFEGVITGIRLKDHRCTNTLSCKYCRSIKCPVCGNEKITIISRRPIW